MIDNINEIKKELHTFLYPNNIEENNIDENGFKKALYKLMRECIKNQEYEVEIGSYEINIDPASLSVKYETDQTTVEVSNEDVYYESIRDTETRFFCITQVRKDEYLMDNPLIRVSGTITNIAGVTEEHYLLDLYTNDPDKIENYLVLPSNATARRPQEDNDYSVMIARPINRTDNRTDVIDFLDKNKVVPVFLDTVIEKYKAQPDRKEFNPVDYSILLPTLDEKKRLISYIYNLMVEFYTEYLNNN